MYLDFLKVTFVWKLLGMCSTVTFHDHSRTYVEEQIL